MEFWRAANIESANYVLGQRGAPVIVWVVIIATLASNLTGEAVFGFQVPGFGWFIPLVLALYILIAKPGRPSLPYWIWMPWIGMTISYLLFADAEAALQRTVMLLTPIVIGMAVSKSAIAQAQLLHIESLLDKFSMAFLIAILVKSGLALTGVLPDVTGLAPQSTTAALFGSYCAAKYAFGNRRVLTRWLMFAAVPVIAVTRTAIVAVGLTLPLTFAPFPAWKRTMLVICIALVGLLVFNSERVQEKMFYSGEGTIFDLRWDNPDLRTTGRKAIEEAMKLEIEDSPWFGHGANASEQIVLDLTNDTLTHPHNDYLRLMFDYGYAGTFVFLICMIIQTLHALRAGYRSGGSARLFLIAGAGAFVPFAILMATDNIILYAAFFGNLHFMMLGAGYAAIANKDRLASSAKLNFR